MNIRSSVFFPRTIELKLLNTCLRSFCSMSDSLIFYWWLSALHTPVSSRTCAAALVTKLITHHPACPYIYYYSSSPLTLFICKWNRFSLTLFFARRQGIFPPSFWRFHCAEAELTLLPLMCLLNCLAASSRLCAASAATRPASAASTASAAAATRPPPAAPEGRMELEMACVFLTWKSSSLLGCLL